MFLSLNSSKRELFDALVENVKRAERAEAERDAVIEQCEQVTDQRDAARAEMERLREAQSNFLAALDYWIDELYQHGVEIVNVPSRSTMLETRAALDAKEQAK